MVGGAPPLVLMGMLVDSYTCLYIPISSANLVSVLVNFPHTVKAHFPH